jgi:hypothetical protein
MAFRRFIVVAVLFSLTGCVHPKPRPEAEEDLRALAFWHLLDQNPSTGPSFLEIIATDSLGRSFRTDPSNALMKRLSPMTGSVEKVSRSVSSPSGERYHIVSGRKGKLLWVGTVRWLSEHKAVIACGMVCGNLCAEVHELTLCLTWRGWSIEEESPHAIS